MKKQVISFTLISLFSANLFSQCANPCNSDPQIAPPTKGYKLVWSDEFNVDGKPDSNSWRYEHGFVRNNELQWYQSDNVNCSGGVLRIEGRCEQIKNSDYLSGSTDWRKNREYANYSSASINTEGFHSWLYGRFEVRAKIPVAEGSWPAIWALGVKNEWPLNGEIDLMEFYRINNVPSILANAAWGTDKKWTAKWDGSNKPLSYFMSKDPNWADKFHIWRMDWNKDNIKLYLDDELLIRHVYSLIIQ